MPPSSSAASKSGSQPRQSTLFGFFGKPVNGPAPTQSTHKADNKQAASRNDAKASLATPPPTVRRPSGTQHQSSTSDPHPDSASASGRSDAHAPSSPLQSRSSASLNKGRTGTQAGKRSAILEMTPPSSSPPRQTDGDEDMDEDDEVVTRFPRRRAAVKRSVNYAESGDEANANDDDDDDDEDAYSPQQDRPAKKQKGDRRKSASSDDDDEFDDDDDDFIDHDALERMELDAIKKQKSTPSAMAKTANSTIKKATSSRPSPSSSSTAPSAARKPVAAQSRPSVGSRNSSDKANQKASTPTEQPYEFLTNPMDENKNTPGHPDYDKRSLFIPPKTLSQLTPFEKQFWNIKRKHNDTVLFFQKGKFYELYEDDAVIAHREFGLKMTDRVRMKMAGVPESSFTIFANKFLALGYKVGRVDQCETAVGMAMRKDGTMAGKGPATAGGDDGKIVRRELKHIYTNGTIVDADCLPDEMNSYCVSIKEVIFDPVTQSTPSDKDDESLSLTPVFGICFLDAGVAEFKIRHFTDDVSRTQLETLLRSMRIKEVIHEKGGLSKRTLRIIRNTVAHDCNITMLKPGTEFYDAEQTLRKLNLVFNPDLNEEDASLTIDDVDPVDPALLPDGIRQVLDKPEALSALGGMLNYLTQLNLEKDVCASRNFDIFDPAVHQDCMILDAQSLTHLNILTNEQGDTQGTLISLVNRASTPFGKRLMRIWLLSPLAKKASICARQEAVEALMQDSSFRQDFDTFGKSLPDIERIMPRIYAGNCKSRDFARVLKALSRVDENVQLLAERSSDFPTDTVETLLRGIPAVSEFAREIQAMYQDEQTFEPRRGADETYDEANAHVDQVERNLAKELTRAAGIVKLPRDRVKFKDIGTNEIYQIEVPKNTKVPIEWTLVSQTQSVKRYYSPEVRQLVKQLKEGRETRLAALKGFQARLFTMFQEHGNEFLLAIKGISELDCLVSLAKASHAMGVPSCKPDFVESENAFVSFAELRHPCLAVTTTSEFIANDIALGMETSADNNGDEIEENARVTILTGGNMAGKSTTARTTATAVILAQLGCRVPAEHARLSPIDRIASRMGANDQLFRNNSTFMVEMLEASRILKDCTPRSLVIMDELGRGTSTFDGQAIAYAVLHHLIGRTRSLSFFLTHYTTLAHEFQGRFGVSNKHMQVLVDSELREVVFTYKLVNGIAESSYGTEVAALAGVPIEICDRATHISRDFAAATKEAEAKRLEKLGDGLNVATLSDFALLFKAGLAKEKNEKEDAVEDDVKMDDSSLRFLREQIATVLAARQEPQQEAKEETAEQDVQNCRRPKVYGRQTYGQRRAHRTDEQADGDDRSDKKSSTESCRVQAEHSTNTKRSLQSEIRRQPKSQAQQLTLELGQKVQVECKTCSMSYVKTDANDVKEHQTFCQRVTHGTERLTVLRVKHGAGRRLAMFRLHASKCATYFRKSAGQSSGVQPVPCPTNSQFVTLQAYDLSADAQGQLRVAASGHGSLSSTSLERALRQMQTTMDEALGAVPLDLRRYTGTKILLAHFNDRVVGAALVGRTSADVVVRRQTWRGGQSVQADSLASAQPPLAVYRIHVVPALRRSGVGRAMLDAALDDCIYGSTAADVVRTIGGGWKANTTAFSQPTEEGLQLARAWVNDDRCPWLLTFEEQV